MKRFSFGRIAGAFVVLATFGFGGCAQQPQQLAANAHSKEYFPSSVYGRASRRVVDNGPVPHGGGQYLVGRPYTVAGQTYYPSEKRLVQVGNASWYGDAFHGRLTANGEIYDRNSFTAAHPTMPLPSYARVTNLRNRSSIIVRVNDRGPFAADRVMDVSSRVAEALDFKRTGTAKVKVEYVGRASLAGSDDAKLYATLRSNEPAQWRESEPTMVAEAQAPQRVASIAPMTEMSLREIPLREMPSHEAPRRERRPEVEPVAYEPVRPRPVVRAEPIPMERPRAAQREPAPPVMRWQSGPAGDFSAPTARHDPPTTQHMARVQHAMEPLPRPLARTAMQTTSVAREPLPPSRHSMDLGTIPGAGVPIGTLHRSNPVPLRLARSRDD